MPQLNEEASDAVLEIENAYSKKRRPLYDQRNELLKQIPNFWAEVLLRHPELAEFASEDDEQILQHVTEVIFMS